MKLLIDLALTAFGAWRFFTWMDAEKSLARSFFVVLWGLVFGYGMFCMGLDILK